MFVAFFVLNKLCEKGEKRKKFYLNLVLVWSRKEKEIQESFNQMKNFNI